MTDKAIFSADYVDLVFRKTRKVAIISLEIPIEASAAFVAAFGTPSQATGVPVAIARLEPEKPASEAPKPIVDASERERRKWDQLLVDASERERKKWDQLRPAQQAAMRCNEQAFWQFLYDAHDSAQGTEAAAQFVRNYCGVKSRADILDGSSAARKWAHLDRSFQTWLRV